MDDSKNFYLAYKRDERFWMFWLTNTANSVVKQTGEGQINTTGQLTVSAMLATCMLIATHLKMTSIPDVVYRILHSVIQARKVMNSNYETIVAFNRDPEMEESNQSHLIFVKALERCFEILGGRTWLEEVQETSPSSERRDDAQCLEILSNAFSVLELDHGVSEDDGSDTNSPIYVKHKSKRKKGKGRKKGGRTARKSKDASSSEEDQTLDIPWESYRIIQDTEGIMTDYLLALHGLVQEWVHLRSNLRIMWREVAYDGLNSAVAASVSQLTVTMIKRSESAIFVDFPGHDSFEVVMQTLTLGDIDKVQGLMGFQLFNPDDDPSNTPKIPQNRLEVRETFLIHAYNYLLDFLCDFQKSFTGKPTKAMKSGLGGWDPAADLTLMSDTERLEWRRQFTINWLYDLVNLYGSVDSSKSHGSDTTQTRRDSAQWSEVRLNNANRRLLGLGEFAETVTTLANQKTVHSKPAGSRWKIAPSLVFELQCIVDATCVARGWSTHTLRGHFLQPPASKTFKSRKDIDKFISRRPTMDGGILSSMMNLARVFQDVPPYKAIATDLEHLHRIFATQLGKCAHVFDANNVPPSRFAQTDSNGLMSYSPYHCGAALAEALELAYRFGKSILDKIPEPLLLVHLYAMLSTMKQYIPDGNSLFEDVLGTFPHTFFGTDNLEANVDLWQHRFPQALKKRLASTLLSARRPRERSGQPQNSSDMNTSLSKGEQSILVLLRDTDRDMERIPDVDLPMPSYYAATRAAWHRHTTGRNHAMIQKWYRKSPGWTDETFGMIYKDFFAEQNPTETKIGDHMSKVFPDKEYTHFTSLPAGRHGCGIGNVGGYVRGSEFIETMEVDIRADVCGDGSHWAAPLGSVNFFEFILICMKMWEKIEDRLEEQDEELYLRAHRKNGEVVGVAPAGRPRVTLALLAASNKAPECLQVMADVFNGKLTDSPYGLPRVWPRLEHKLELYKRDRSSRPDDLCCVM